MEIHLQMVHFPAIAMSVWNPGDLSDENLRRFLHLLHRGLVTLEVTIDNGHTLVTGMWFFGHKGTNFYQKCILQLDSGLHIICSDMFV